MSENESNRSLPGALSGSLSDLAARSAAESAVGADHPLTAEELKEVVGSLHQIIARLRGTSGSPKSRSQAIAVTKIQEACFWLLDEIQDS